MLRFFCSRFYSQTALSDRKPSAYHLPLNPVPLEYSNRDDPELGRRSPSRREILSNPREDRSVLSHFFDSDKANQDGNVYVHLLYFYPDMYRVYASVEGRRRLKSAIFFFFFNANSFRLLVPLESSSANNINQL